MSCESNEKLNQLLKGEHMAIKAIGDVISVVKEPELKNSLTAVQNRHHDNVQVLASHLASRGATPEQSAGILGAISGVSTRINNLVNSDPAKMLEHLCEGEDRGIQMAQQVVDGFLDQESLKLVKNILDNDRKNLKILRKELNRYG